MRERGLGRAVGGEAAVAQTADERRDVHHRAVPGGDEVGERGLRELKRGAHVEVERLLERAHVGARERRGHRTAHVVDHDVDAAELVGRALRERVEVGELVEVGGHHQAATAERAHVGSDLLELLLGAGGDGDIGAGLRERPGTGSADAAATGGDDGHFAVEAEQVEDHGHS